MRKSRFLPFAPFALVVALVLSSPIATAGVINNYDFSSGPLGAPVTFASSVPGGPTVTITGYLWNATTEKWEAKQVNHFNNGLGVHSDPGDSADAQIGQRLEGMLFDLGSVVYGDFTLDYMGFSNTDNADIWVSTTGFNAAGSFYGTQVADDGNSDPFTSGSLIFRYIFVTNGTTSGDACNQLGSSCFRVASLQVEVEDTTPPTITVPATVTIDATSPAGATVNYVVSAVDAVDPYPTVTCAPATGSTFPIGTTVVNCTATNAFGNSATANFTVIVTGPSGQILNLIASVNSFNIANGIANSLDAKLQGAFDALDAARAGNLAAACNKIAAFINEVQAQSGKALTAAQASQFIAAANQVRASLGCA